MYEKSHKTVLTGAGFSIIGRVFGALLGLVALALLNRLFEKDAGLWTFAFSIIILIEPFARCGLTEGVQKFTSIFATKKEWQNVKGTLLGGLQIAALASLFSIIVFYIFTPQIAEYFSKNTEFSDAAERLCTVLRIYSLYLAPFVFTTIMLAFLRALKNITATVFVENVVIKVGWILAIVIAAYIPTHYDRINLLIWGAVISTVFTAACTWIIIPKAAPQIKNVKANYGRKALFLFSVPLIFQTLLLIFMKRIDILMIKYFYAVEGFNYVKSYFAAGTISAQASFVLVAFGSLFAPMIASFYHKKDFEQLNSLYQTVTRWCMAIVLPLVAAIILMPDLTLQALNIDPTSMATATVIILTLGQLASISVGHSGFMLIMSGRTKLTLTNNLIALVINLALNYILIPKYAMTGAAVATVTAICLRNLLSMLEIKFIMKSSPFCWSTAKYILIAFIASLIVFALRYLMPDITWYYGLPLFGSILGVIYLALMPLVIDPADKKTVLKILGNLKSR